MTSQQKRRIRATNFTPEEKKLLIDFVKENVKILEYKGVDPKSNRKKVDCWNRCSQRFQANGFVRDASKLKDTYHRMKHAAKVNIRKYEHYLKAVKGNRLRLNYIESPSEIDYAIMQICPRDFQIDHGFMEGNSHYNQQMVQVKEEPEGTTDSDSHYHNDDESFRGEQGPIDHLRAELYRHVRPVTPYDDSSSNHGNPMIPSIRLDTRPNSETGFTDNHHFTTENDKEVQRLKVQALEEEGRCKMELHQKLLEEQNLKIKALEEEEKRRAELHQKVLEEQNLKIQILKKQLNEFK